MSRRVIAAAVAAALVVLTSILGGPLGNAAEAEQQTFLTFYGWWDNTPPGGNISYPQIHQTAGGVGSYDDPITLATSTGEMAPGTRVWVPRVAKYFIMEDQCGECNDEWYGEGPNGGPMLWHFDLWLGGEGGNAMQSIDCEDALTHYTPEHKPVMEKVLIDPPADEPYDPTPIFDINTGECYGGAKPITTVGHYANVATGQCIDDPDNSSSPGTVLTTADCSGAVGQKFTFHGAFLQINDLCATKSGSTIQLATCDAGPDQQWSVNPNGTISDIQTGRKCFRSDAPASLIAGSCSDAASQWTFTPETR